MSMGMGISAKKLAGVEDILKEAPAAIFGLTKID
jgi:hypothetical protein